GGRTARRRACRPARLRLPRPGRGDVHGLAGSGSALERLVGAPTLAGAGGRAVGNRGGGGVGGASGASPPGGPRPACARGCAVARLALELAQSPPPGRLREAFADIVGDPALELACPLERPGRIVDAQGQAVELHAENEHTSLVAGDRMLAVLAHRRGLLDDEEL